MKKICLLVLLLLVLSLFFASCEAKEPDPVSPFEPSSEAEEEPKPKPISVSVGVMNASEEEPVLPFLSAEKETDVRQDEKYDAVFLNISIADFLNAGFSFGDSCDITFSNGLAFEDIPFYNGYYVRSGLPLIVGYPGYQYVAVTCNNEGLWTKAGLRDGDNATVTLREAGKYADVQEALSQTYSNDRSEYANDSTFANFRSLSGGKLKKDFLFRGASPVDNEKNRAPYANALLEQNEIGFVLDLADSETDLFGYFEDEDFCSDYAKKLYDEGNMALLSMSSNYGSDSYKQKLASGFVQMLEAKGKIYVHCLEGKDRTGFVCVLLEALSGASYDEMLSDYMKTYENYYGVTEAGTPEKYAAIADLYFNAFASYLHGTEDVTELKSADYTADAESYLLDAGMTQEEIDALKALITE